MMGSAAMCCKPCTWVVALHMHLPGSVSKSGLPKKVVRS